MSEDPFATPNNPEEEKAKENPFSLTKPREVGDGVVAVEVDTRITTAHAYPRSIQHFMAEALFEATYSAEIAEEMWYARPVDDKGTEVEGPSIRLAEIMAKAYGNLDFGFDILGHDGKMLKVVAWCWDLEKNNKVTVNITRRITKKNGRIFGDSMIQTTGLAAGSIGVRNVIFKIIPKVFAVEILKAAKAKYAESLGEGEDLEGTIVKALEWFEAKGIDSDALLRMLDLESVTDITAEDVVRLRGTMTAIIGGDLTVAEFLKEYGAAGSKVDDDEDEPRMAERLRQETEEGVPE